MQDRLDAMVKSLVAVAWADGRLDERESQVVEALIRALDLSGSQADAVRRYARTPRSLDEAPLENLSPDDRRVLLQHAVLITYVDGEQTVEERAALLKLSQRLSIPGDEAQRVIDSAERRSRRLSALR